MKGHNMSNNRGFTLIELCNVILILSILAIIALPKFIDLTDQAYTARGWGNVGALRAASYIFYAVSALSTNLDEPRFPENSEELESQLVWTLEWEDGGGYEQDGGSINP